jgi:hypothetical protein
MYVTNIRNEPYAQKMSKERNVKEYAWNEWWV